MKTAMKLSSSPKIFFKQIASSSSISLECKFRQHVARLRNTVIIVAIPPLLNHQTGLAPFPRTCWCYPQDLYGHALPSSPAYHQLVRSSPQTLDDRQY